MSTVRVNVNQAAVHALLRSAPIVRDLERRAENVRSAAASSAAQVSTRWAAAMAKEERPDDHGQVMFAVGWRHNMEWRGHFFEFGTVQPNHPPHPALRSSIDAARH